MKRTFALAMLALPVAAHAATFTVLNLNDSGAGSLRDAIAQSNAASGSNVINFAPGLTGTIVLTTGQLVVTQGPLTITGPGPAVLAIDGNANDRILVATDSPELACPSLTGPSDYLVTISGLTFRNGNRTASNSGGAIISLKSLTLQNVVVDGNQARVGGGIAFGTQYAGQTLTILDSQFINNLARPLSAVSAVGGGIAVQPVCSGVFSQTVVNITRSSVRDNDVAPANSQQGYAAGIYLVMKGTATISDSRIVGNQVILPATPGAFSYAAGGIGADVANLIVTGSEISGNQASSGGGIELFNVDTLRQGAADRNNFTLVNSTVSGNTAYSSGGGVQAVANVNVDIRNSTISANTALPANTGGLRFVNNAGLTPPTASIASSIIAANNAALDIGVNTTNIPAPLVVPTSNSLVQKLQVASSLALPGAGNLLGASPGLGPLAFNGGLTQTHALLPTSLAIDTGSNPSSQTTDQRGTGFARVLGSAPDMGAWEYPASCAGFTDMSAGGFCPNVDWMRNRAITLGCGAGLYCPLDNVLRDQMAAFMNRSGKVLSPETLSVQESTGPITLPGEFPIPAVRKCITTSATSLNYPRQALVIATMSGLADGNVASWRTPLVVSYDGGANWDNLAPSVSVGPRLSADPNGWGGSLVVEKVELPPGVTPAFAINIRRDNQTVSVGNLVEGRCQLTVEIYNRTVTTAPY